VVSREVGWNQAMAAAGALVQQQRDPGDFRGPQLKAPGTRLDLTPFSTSAILNLGD